MDKVEKKIKIPYLVFIVTFTAFIFMVGYFLAIKEKNKFVKDYLETEKIKAKGCLKKDYHNKCLLARQVYQWSWFEKVTTKAGKLNLIKHYAMTLKEYNDLIDLSWELNKYIGIGNDKRFMMLCKWILESSINNTAEHKTDEILILAGYIKSCFIKALYYYKHELNIDKGSKLYIKELFDKHLSPAKIKRIFSKWENVVKFDYAYIWYLKQKYGEQWDKILTAFHWDEWMIDQWEKAGLKMIPNYRVDKKHVLWLRSYYQTVFEMSNGIEVGWFHQISKYSYIVSKFRKSNRYRLAYIETLRIKFKQKENIDKIKADFEKVENKFKEYMKLNLDLMQKINKLNDVNYDIKINKYKKRYKDIKAKLITKIKALQNKIIRRFK